MLRELKFRAGELGRLREALLSLRSSEDVLLLRQGAVEVPKEKWIDLIEAQAFRSERGAAPDRSSDTSTSEAQCGGCFPLPT